MKNVDKKINTDIAAHSIPGFILEDSVIASIFNNNQAIMLIIDPGSDQKILDANVAACEFYGYSHEQFINLDNGDINTLSLEERQRTMKEAIMEPHSYFHFIHKTRTGLLKDVEVDASPISLKTGKVMFIIVHDITIQKRVESKLRESQERLESALEGSDLGLWDWKFQTGESYYDERWANIIGYTLEELSPLSINTWLDNVHPVDLEKYNIQIKKCFNKEIDSHESEIRMRHKNGSWVWVRSKGKVVEWSKDGKPVRSAGTHLDITDRKMAEIKLSESEDRFRSYFDSSPLALWEEDHSRTAEYLQSLPVSNGNELADYLDIHPEEVEKCLDLLQIINVNKASLDLYEADNKEQIINNLQNIFTSSTLEAYKDELINVYRKSSSMVFFFTDKTLKGNSIDVKLEMTLQTGYRYLATIINLTESKRYETELKILLAQTKSDTETKEVLLKEINHRVKNNLSSLIGLLYAEKRKTKNKYDVKQIDLLNNLINRVKGISIAHDLLSRSAWRPISVELLSEKIVNSLKHLIPSDRSIETKISKSSVLLDADQSQSMAVIINELFVNSLEHASLPGGILEIDIKIVEMEGSVYYYYKDNGPGFSKEILKSKSFNVGLYLIKNIAEQSLRGKITLKNKNGAFIEIQFPGGGKIAEI